MKRIILVLSLAALMAAIMVVYAGPAMAQVPCKASGTG